MHTNTPNGAVATYTYDELGRLKTVSDVNQQTTTYEYDANGNLDSVLLPNGVTSNYDYSATNRLENLGSIKTDGVDLKGNWISPDWNWGHVSASVQSTWINEYKAVDADGNVATRAVGIEVSDSAIPEWQTNMPVLRSPLLSSAIWWAM